MCGHSCFGWWLHRLFQCSCEICFVELVPDPLVAFDAVSKYFQSICLLLLVVVSLSKFNFCSGNLFWLFLVHHCICICRGFAISQFYCLWLAQISWFNQFNYCSLLLRLFLFWIRTFNVHSLLIFIFDWVLIWWQCSMRVFSVVFKCFMKYGASAYSLAAFIWFCFSIAM